MCLVRMPSYQYSIHYISHEHIELLVCNSLVIYGSLVINSSMIS